MKTYFIAAVLLLLFADLIARLSNKPVEKSAVYVTVFFILFGLTAIFVGV